MGIRFGRRRERDGIRVSCVVVAGGSSSRMGGVDKLTLPLGDSTVIGQTLRALDRSADIDELVLVVRPGREAPILEAASGVRKLGRIVPGGSDRSHSALNGVRACAREAELILIHDGARPLVTAAVIRDVVEAARKYGAAVPAVPVTDTIKLEQDGFAVETPPREKLFAAQTPQAFRAELIRAALEDGVQQGLSLTDDCAAVERLGMRVFLSKGDARNRKLTYPWELGELECLWKEQQNADRTRL